MKKDTKQYRVFALYAEPPGEDPIIYVGKSCMRDLKAIMRYLKKSELTAEFFEPGLEAAIVFLEAAGMTKEMAYKHQIAWLRYYYEADWDVVCDLNLMDACTNLYGEAERIYQEISRISLKEAFSRCQDYEEDRSADAVAATSKVLAEERISIRVTKQERDDFASMCREKQITQREGFQILMSRQGDMGAEVETIKKLKSKLHEQLLEIEKRKDAAKESRRAASEAYRSLQTGIHEYLRLRDDLEAIDEPRMKCWSWNAFTNRCPDYSLYNYPETEAHFCMRVDAMCYGHGSNAAIFVYGLDCETGALVKLRFYQRNDFCGMHPAKSPYFTEGAVFLVGCRHIYPDVADLVYAFPLPKQDETRGSEKTDIPDGRWGDDWDVDSLISNATWRSKGPFF